MANFIVNGVDGMSKQEQELLATFRQLSERGRRSALAMAGSVLGNESRMAALLASGETLESAHQIRMQELSVKAEKALARN